jgi:hypothetical protein
MMDKVLLSAFDTTTNMPLLFTLTPNGPLPTGMVNICVCRITSITDKVSDTWFAAYALLPLGVKEMPPGKLPMVMVLGDDCAMLVFMIEMSSDTRLVTNASG